MDIGVIFGQMLVLLAMMALGYFSYKKSWVTDDTAGHLSKLVVNIFNPILVVNGVLGQNSADAGADVVWNILFMVLYFVILLVVGFLLPALLRPEKSHKNIYRLMTIFSNVGFMGIPVIKSILGDEAMIYVAFYILGYNIMLYTVGMFLAQKAGEEKVSGDSSYLEALAANTEDLTEELAERLAIHEVFYQTKKSGVTDFFKRMLNPGVLAAFFAVFVFATGMQMPEPVVTFCDYMGNSTIPLSMIMIGISMAQANPREVFTDWRMYAFIVLRMIALPLAVLGIFNGVLGNLTSDAVISAWNAMDANVFGVFMIELGMPVGSIIVMMTRENGGDADYCTRGVVLSTLASIVTIPLICAFL